MHLLATEVLQMPVVNVEVVGMFDSQQTLQAFPSTEATANLSAHQLQHPRNSKNVRLQHTSTQASRWESHQSTKGLNSSAHVGRSRDSCSHFWTLTLRSWKPIGCRENKMAKKCIQVFKTILKSRLDRYQQKLANNFGLCRALCSKCSGAEGKSLFGQ
jgi:hypothetical protein